MSSDLRSRTRLAKRQAFVDAARGILDLDGTDALTMQRVAAELVCGVGSIYRYFASKDELVEAVHEDQVQTLELLLDEVGPDPDPLSRLLALGRAWAAAGRTHRGEVRTVQRLVATLDRTVDPLAAGIVGTFAGAIDDAVAAGALDPGDGPARARVLLTAIGDAAVLGDEVIGVQLLRCLLIAWGAEERS